MAAKDPSIIRRDQLVEWFKEAKELYPNLLAKATLPPPTVPPTRVRRDPISRGFECAIGWKKPVDEMLKELDALGGVQIVQLKEKFGSLRVYTLVDSTLKGPTIGDTLHEARIVKYESILRKAMKECDETCEYCGEPGVLQNTSWLSVKCDACKKDMS